MAQIVYRGNLANDDFPLLSAFKGQTVIVGRIDQDYELDVKSTQKLQREKQIPQLYYCHNVVPTGQGYQSVGYNNKVNGIGSVLFNDGFVLRDPNENKVLFSPALGTNYIFNANVGAWASINPVAGAGRLVTVCYLNGETYIFYQKLGCYRYDRATLSIVPVVLTGLVVANINGICAAQGFLIAWDDNNTVYRSQAASPLNFTPDPSLGSGSGIPQDIRGKIVVILPIAGGYIVYTTKNAVAGVFQQNIRYPFIYREVAGSAGVVSPNHVSWQDNLGDHYAWTVAGLQKVDKSRSEPIFPEITDFLIAQIFEDYDTATDTFTITNIGNQLDVHVTSVGGRFIIISYGVLVGTYTHALIYDLAEKRLGKLKITHVDCFEYNTANLTNVTSFENPKEIIAFLQNNGTVQTVNFNLTHTGDSGVIVLGKFQFVRERWLELEMIELENIDQAYNFSIRILQSFDGKNIDKVTKDPTMLRNIGQFRRWGTHGVQGKNLSIVGVGTFHLTTDILTFTVGGKR